MKTRYSGALGRRPREALSLRGLMVGALAAGALATGALAVSSPAAAQKKDAPPAAAAPAAAVPAAAEKPAATPSADALTNAVVKDAKAKPRVIDFEDETIRGTLTKPEGDFIDAARRAKQKSLIKIRRHFVPELLKSADDL